MRHKSNGVELKVSHAARGANLSESGSWMASISIRYFACFKNFTGGSVLRYQERALEIKGRDSEETSLCVNDAPYANDKNIRWNCGSGVITDSINAN